MELMLSINLLQIMLLISVVFYVIRYFWEIQEVDFSIGTVVS